MSTVGNTTNADNSLKKDNTVCLITSLFVAFTFGIFAPIEMYFVNINNLWFDLYDILPGLLLITATLFTISYFFIWFFSRLWGKSQNGFCSKIWKIITITISIAGISLYMQGNFLQADYPKAGDETIDWSRFTTEGIVNVIGWVGILTLFLALLYKLHFDRFLRFLKYLMIIIMFVQVTTLITMSFIQHGFMRKNDYVATTEDEWNISNNRNFIIVVLDTYDARVFDEILNSEDGEKYKDILEDFTYYRNTLTVFTLTDFSIPQILTGEEYLNQEDYGPFVDKAYNNSPFLNALSAEGYDMSIYTTVTLPQKGIVDKVSNWHKVDEKSSDYSQMFDLYYRLILFRYLPHYLKASFEINMEDFDRLRAVATIDGHKPVANEDPEVYICGNDEFIEGIPYIKASDDQNDFRFYHIKGIHHPRDLDRNLNKVAVTKKENSGVSLEESARACMVILDMFIERLKTEGIYDNSVIVIMADHGASTYKGGGYVQSPILCIKGFDEIHGFKISEAPVSYEDLQDGFINLLNGKTGEEIFNVKEGDERTRTMYYTHYIGQQRKFTQNEPFIELQTTGHAFDLKYLNMTGVTY